MFSIVRFSSPKAGDRSMLCCVTYDSIWNMDVQKSCNNGHSHIIWRRSPFDLLHV